MDECWLPGYARIWPRRQSADLMMARADSNKVVRRLGSRWLLRKAQEAMVAPATPRVQPAVPTHAAASRRPWGRTYRWAVRSRRGDLRGWVPERAGMKPSRP